MRTVNWNTYLRVKSEAKFYKKLMNSALTDLRNRGLIQGQRDEISILAPALIEKKDEPITRS